MRLVMGDSRDFAPLSPISFLFRFSEKLTRLWRFFKGDNRDYALVSPIEFLSRFRDRLRRLVRGNIVEGEVKNYDKAL